MPGASARFLAALLLRLSMPEIRQRAHVSHAVPSCRALLQPRPVHELIVSGAYQLRTAALGAFRLSVDRTRLPLAHPATPLVEQIRPLQKAADRRAVSQRVAAAIHVAALF
jgi:hypothetical protein